MNLNKNKRYILSILLVLLVSFLCVNCAAPESTTIAFETATTTPVITTDTPITSIVREGPSFIWKITSDSTIVYLLGSVHVADADTYPLANVIEDAFTDADILVVEVNINEVDSMKSLELILEYGAYPEGEGLKDYLSEELYEKLKVQFAEWGINLSLLDPYRPWFIANLLEITSLEMLGYSSTYGIDLHFLEAAEQRNLKIVELETEEFQIGLLAGISDDVMIKSLEMTLDDPISNEDIVELFEIWETGDALAMEEYLYEGLDEEPELLPYFESLFTDRNYTMFEKIAGFLGDDEIYFIVVGAGHLVSDKGLLNLLEEAGYIVEQLEN